MAGGPPGCVTMEQIGRGTTSCWAACREPDKLSRPMTLGDPRNHCAPTAQEECKAARSGEAAGPHHRDRTPRAPADTAARRRAARRPGQRAYLSLEDSLMRFRGDACVPHGPLKIRRRGIEAGIVTPARRRATQGEAELRHAQAAAEYDDGPTISARGPAAQRDLEARAHGAVSNCARAR